MGLKDDREFHLEMGVDVASRHWRGWESLSLDELAEIGRGQLQDADHGAAVRDAIEARNPRLTRHPSRTLGG